MLVYCLALVAASLMPVVVGGAGPVYLAGALLLGIGFLAYAVGFSLRRSTRGPAGCCGVVDLLAGAANPLVAGRHSARIESSLLTEPSAKERSDRGESPGPEALSIFDPASPPAESIRSLSVLVLAITGFIFLVVEGVLIYSIVRFRRRAVGRDDGAAAGLRQQADRDRLDGGAGADRLRPGAGHDPHPLGGERPAAAARSRATTRCSSP